MNDRQDIATGYRKQLPALAAIPADSRQASERPGTAEENSRLQRRFFRFVDRRTSISLEPEEWEMLEDSAARADLPPKYVLMQIDRNRLNASVPSAARMFLLDYWRALEEGQPSPLKRP